MTDPLHCGALVENMVPFFSVSVHSTNVYGSHLITHTSGLGYDLIDPPLLAWHAQNGTTPWTGETIAERMKYPLQFSPGTAWRYGVGVDWAGLVVERVSGQELEDFMRENIWTKLGISKATFWREKVMEEQAAAGEKKQGEWAEPSMLLPPQAATGSDAGPAPGVAANSDAFPAAVPLQGFNMLGGLTKASGGGGLSCTAAEYLSLLKAVLKKDPSILSDESWEELLAPQVGSNRAVSEEAWVALNTALRDTHEIDCGMNLPRNVDKSLSLAGLVSEDTFGGKDEGEISKGTVLWGGMTGMAWVSLVLDMEGFDPCTTLLKLIPTSSSLWTGAQACVGWPRPRFLLLANAQFTTSTDFGSDRSSSGIARIRAVKLRVVLRIHAKFSCFLMHRSHSRPFIANRKR